MAAANQQKGATAIVSIGEETVAAGTASLIGFKVPVNTDTVSAEFSRTTPATLTGTRNPVQPFKGNTDVTGDIVIPVDIAAMWYWLQLMFGDPATSGSSDPYTHVFTVGNSMPYFTHQKTFADLTTDAFYQAVGCKISTASIEFGGDGELTMTLGVMGFNETRETSTCFTTSETTVSLTERLNNFDATLTEGGSATSLVKSFNIDIDFGLDNTQRAIGDQGALSSLPENVITVSGSITGIYADDADAIIDKGANDTESELVLTLESASDSNHTLVFDIQELLYSYKSPEISGNEGLDFMLDWAAYYNNAADPASSVIAVTLNNADAHA